jgi:hypothetical protein
VNEKAFKLFPLNIPRLSFVSISKSIIFKLRISVPFDVVSSIEIVRDDPFIKPK